MTYSTNSSSETSGSPLAPMYAGEFNENERVDGRFTRAEVREWAARRGQMLADLLARRGAEVVAPLPRGPRAPRAVAAA